MKVVLHGKEQEVVLLFSAAAISGPALGGLTGGILTTKYLGGYTSNKAIYVCFTVFLLLIAVSIPTPYVDNLYGVIALVWL